MNNSIFTKFLNLTVIILLSNVVQAQYQSSILHYDSNNRLIYHSDKEGSRIPDFSHVGYKNGEEELPNIPVVLEISPVAGDNTAHIQAAIDEVSAMALDQNGHRGALLFKPGIYSVHGIVYVRKGGVVLRGSGDGDDPTTNTIIRGVGNTPEKRSLFIIGTNIKSSFSGRVSGTAQYITSPYVPAGSRTIEVARPEKYKIGDNIIIKHPSTDEWLAAIDYGGVASDSPWRPGEIDMVFNRYVTKIEGNKIQFDTPLYHELDLALSKPYVYTYDGSSQITECGVESIRFLVETKGWEDGDHAADCVSMIGVRDSWVKDVTALQMGYAGVKVEEATRVTIIETEVLRPHGPISGGWRYNFYVGDNSNNILVKNCVGSRGRHTFVSNGASTVNGVVFTGCSSVEDYTRSESHRRWGQGMLWDNMTWTETNTFGVLGLHNRGDYGTGHGWSITNGVAWNIKAPDNQIAVQKPPIGQNFAIGCNAIVDNDGPFPHPVGYIEGTGETMLIPSLYQAQLNERLNYGVSPDAPGRLTPVNFMYNDQEQYVELTWYDIALDEDYYKLERSADGGITYQELVSLPANTETYTDSNLEQANYFYRLKAVNAIGSSAYSNITESKDYQAPLILDITFQVSLEGISNQYEGGFVWLEEMNGDEVTRYVMEDLNEDMVYGVTLSLEEQRQIKYRFAYQTGTNPDTDFVAETVTAPCGDSNNNRTLDLGSNMVYLPIVKFASCDEEAPSGSDITNIEGITIVGSNDDEEWINGSEGAGSPVNERIEKMIDNNYNSKYLVRAVQSWFDISSDKLSRTTGYTITSANDAPNRDPKDWELKGWDEQKDAWVLIHKVKGNSSWEAFGAPKTWSFENDKWYKKYRFEILDINGDTQGLMQMAEIEIWGIVEGQLSVNKINPAYSIVNYPNPFKTETHIRFQTLQKEKVIVEVYDIFGRRVITLANNLRAKGKQEFTWRASGRASGVYFCKITIGQYTTTRKLVLTNY